MKRILLFFAFQATLLTAYAQFGPQQIISTNSIDPYWVIPEDIDDDGYMDILVLFLNDYKIAWFKNQDGLGDFSSEILINNNSALYNSFEFVDLDSDGDKDILYEVNNPHKIAWLENLDGAGEFGPEQVLVENQPDFITGVRSADLDGDGDHDLMISYTDTFQSRLVWLEMSNGPGNFEEEVILMDGPSAIYFPLIVDIDSDGDLDLITAYELFFGPAKIVWFENLGGGIFEEEQEIYQFDVFSDWTSVYNMTYADINTDGIPDLAVTTHHDDFGNSYLWYEHLDGEGSFGDSNALANSGVSFTNYQFHDFDNDGDNDILSTSGFIDNRISWVENSDGLGSFSIDRIITTEIDFLKSARAADFNGDGLLDVVSASLGDDKVAWYENTGILNVVDNSILETRIYPNPTHGELNIVSNSEMETIIVYDLFGKKVKTFKNVDLPSLDEMSSGIYFIECTNQNGVSSVHKVVKL